MNSPTLVLERLNEITGEARRDSPLALRCGLLAAARLLLSDIEKHVIAELGDIDGYMSEKIRNSQWHIAAALGFDIDNGHDDEQHRVWAYGQLGTLADLLKERFPDDR